MTKIGYARVSTKGQKDELQIDALQKAGCEIIFKDHGISGKTKFRPELDKCLEYLKKGDILVVWKLDRLFRSVRHFASFYADLQKMGVEFISVTQAFDTTTSTGRLMMNILSSFAEFESEIISERVSAGMQASKREGNKMGPKIKYLPEQIIKGAVPKSTYYRRMKNG